MLHLIVFVLVIGSFLIFSFPLILLERRMEKKDPERQRVHSLHIVQKVLAAAFRSTGSEITVLGRENIPDCAVLYVGNHRSYFDILVSYPQVPGPTGFVAKKEMERYLTLTAWMRLVNCLFLDRNDLKAGLRTILEGIEKIKSGVSLWIFPEGTRNTSDDILDLMTFHEGSMKIADKSGCPVIPVAITGTREIFESHVPWIRPSKVTIEFGKPVYLKELPPENRKHSGDYIRGLIIELLKAEQIRRG